MESINDIESVYIKSLSKTNEKIPAIGIGTKGIQNYRLAEEALVYAFNLGLRLIEISEEYGNGLAEELVGKIIKKFNRDEIFIVLRIKSNRFSDIDSAIKATSSSLKRMMTSYADVVLLDGLSDLIPINIQIKALENLVDKGLSRYIGLSNFKLKDIAKVFEVLSKHNIMMLQAKYSVLDRRIEKDILRFAIDNNITLIACTPLEKGNIKNNPRLIFIANKYRKSPIQVALAYLISKPCVVATPKSERKQHIDEIYGALSLRLSIEDIKFLGE